jgi:hypothetical protein
LRLPYTLRDENSECSTLVRVNLVSSSVSA